MRAITVTSPVLALALIAGTPGGIAHAQDNQRLPVSAVTLYRSGVGSFERAGSVSGDATVRLDASADQIDDLLKSLVVLDLDGGRVGGVTYTADEPVTRLLDALGVSSPSQLSLNSILAGFKGSEVMIEATGRRAISGRILGVDTLVTKDDADASSTRFRVSILSGTGIVTIHDDEIDRITFADDELRADFNALLLALAEQRTERSRALEIELRGEGDRRIRTVYTQETPVWKTSYRVLLPEDGAGTLRLQGWAIVENTTDSDWDNISLSLVAGRPVGFTMPLSQPLYVPRQALPVPVELAAASKAYSAGQSSPASSGSTTRGLAAEIQDRQVGARVMRELNRTSRLSEDATESMESSFASAASAGESGEVFFFRLDKPVSVGRRQSAMLPILTEEITGRRVSIASVTDGIGHPMRGLEMTNSSGLKLMPGPISVYDGTAFAGDAQIGYVGAGEDRLLAFGVDLDVDIERKPQSRNRVRKLAIRNGVIIQTTESEMTEKVSIDNKDSARGRTVIVETTRHADWERESSSPVYEEAPGVYRFAIDVEPGKQASLEVKQSRVSSSSVSLTSIDLETVIRYSRQGAVSQAVLDAFKGYQERRTVIDDLASKINELDAEASRIAADQNRIRGLLGPLSRQDDLYGRYLRSLEQSEDRLDVIRTNRATLAADRASHQAELDSYVQSLNVE